MLGVVNCMYLVVLFCTFCWLLVVLLVRCCDLGSLVCWFCVYCFVACVYLGSVTFCFECCCF